MPFVPVTSSQSGTRITVNDWLKDPTRIPQYVVSLAEQGFLADVVLRPGGAVPAGVVEFEETTPLYIQYGIPDRTEGQEVPVVTGQRGQPNVAYTKQKAARILVTEEQRTRNKINVLSDTMIQTKNTFIQTYDDMFLAAVLNNANIHTQVASGLWSVGATDIRGDLIAAARQVSLSSDAQGSRLGYKADTLIVSDVTSYDVINSDQFNKVYENGGNIADEHLRYTGKLPQKILTFNVLESPRVPAGVAILLQRNKCGFICDEWPLEGLSLEEDRNRLSWSSIIRRSTAMGLDAPLSVTKIVGVSS